MNVVERMLYEYIVVISLGLHITMETNLYKIPQLVIKLCLLSSFVIDCNRNQTEI